MGKPLINGLLFNLSWLAIVYPSSNVLAPLVAAVHVTVHMRWLGLGSRELGLIALVTLFGLVLDQLLFAAGLFTLSGQASLAPVWLSCLWPVLATTLLHAFSFLHGRWPLAAVLGAVGGCGSYLAGTRLTEVAFADPFYGPLMIAGLWAVLMPALLFLAAGLAERGVLRDATSQA